MSNKQTKKHATFLLYVIVVTLCVLLSCIMIFHEKAQNEEIKNLSAELNYIKEKLRESDVEWKDDTYNYLAIGNSITVHGINEYWWNEVGMAASQLEKDYVHQTAFMLKEKINQEITVFPYNFYVWEVSKNDRSEFLPLLDGYLNEKINLVTVQLSENVSDLSSFEDDFEEMLLYVRSKAPNAEIIVIGDFWDDAEKDNMKKRVCLNCEIKFLSLAEIKNQEDYQCGMGTVVYDGLKKPHIVQHEGVAEHPNDKAMRWIASRIVEQVE